MLYCLLAYNCIVFTFFNTQEYIFIKILLRFILKILQIPDSILLQIIFV